MVVVNFSAGMDGIGARFGSVRLSKKNNGMIFRKRKGGHIPTFMRVVFFPFMLGVQIYNHIVQKRSGSPVIQEIEPGLYLASRLTPMDVDLLKKNKIEAILDATAEFDSFKFHYWAKKSSI
ncbi:hypothetical protein ACFSJQ_12430 [Vibrio olivae]